MKRETYVTPIEVKFDGGGEAMSFSGYGARFGNVDSYGDVIAPGAFTKTLKEAKSSGNWPAMMLQHGNFLGGDDNMPVGVWTDMREDDKGLAVEGRLADTARGRDAYTLLKMQPRPAINGMSIGYRAIEWTMRMKPEDPRRTLKAVDLLEVSLVTFPANGKARVENVKAASEDLRAGVRLLGQAIDMHAGHMDGSIPTTDESQAEMMDLMKQSYSALTDRKVPGGGSMKTIREFEDFLRDVGGYSRAAAKAIAAGGFKEAEPRDEDAELQALKAQLSRNIATLS